jgi:ubiquinone biosynthesis protein UbiJ
MLPLPSFLAPAALSGSLLNKLLQREQWARDRLSRHAGKTVRFMVGGFKAEYAIQATGLVQASDPAVVPDVILTVPAQKLARLPAVLAARDPEAIADIMHVQGDAGLAQVVSDLARDLRWDVEDDLARVVGDVAAVRMIAAGRSLAEGAQTAAWRLAGNASEFISEESGMVASQPAVEAWSARLGDLLGRLDRLESKVSALGRTAGRKSAGGI